MVGQNIGIRDSRLIVGVAVADFVLALLVYRFDGVVELGCSIFTNIAWVAFVVLRLVSLMAHWAVATTYLYESARLLEHSLQLGASLFPLLKAIAG